jgi:hypothetical protein
LIHGATVLWWPFATRRTEATTVDDLLTLTRPPMRAKRPEVIPAAVVGVVLAVLFGLALLTLRTPDMVRLTVDNPLPWRAEVSARAADATGWTGAGSVWREGRLDFLEFPDQGSDWVIRFSYAGQDEEIEITREQLAAQDWTVEVPADFGARLEAAGVAETTSSGAGGS